MSTLGAIASGGVSLARRALPLYLKLMVAGYKVALRFGGSPRTDGNTIWLPHLPYDASQELVACSVGHLVHESAHILYTDFEVYRKAASAKGLFASLLNAVEDPRIERRMIEAAPGTGPKLHLSTELAIKAGHVKKLDSDENALLLYVDLFGSIRMNGYRGLIEKYFVDAEARVQELVGPVVFSKLQALLESGYPAMRSTDDAVDLTKKILELLDAVIQPKPQQGKGKQSKGGKGQQGQSGEPGQGEPGGSEASGGDQTDENAEGDGQSSDGEEEESDKDSESEDGDGGSNDEGDIVEEEKEDTKQGKDGKSKPDSKSGNGGQGEDSEDEDGQGGDPKAVKDMLDKAKGDQSPAVDLSGNLEEKAGKETSAKGKPGKTGATTTTERVLQLVETVPHGDDISGYQQVVEATDGVTQEVARGLVALITRARSRMLRPASTGRIRPGRLWQLRIPEAKAFGRKTESLVRETAVGILQDCSGSMGGIAGLAAQATIAVTRACECARIPVAVWGFDEHFYYLKGFGQPVSEAQGKLGLLPTLPAGSTPLGEALELSVPPLLARPENRRILFVVTDGGPNNRPYAQSIVDAMNPSIEMVGVGIGGHTCEGLFPEFITVERIEDLGAMLLGFLQSRIIRAPFAA